MSGFKITEPDGSVYNHGEELHAKKTDLVKAHKVACQAVDQAQKQMRKAADDVDDHFRNFKGHPQTFQHKARVLIKKRIKSSANFEEKKRQLAELECTLEPSVRQKFAAATSSASDVPQIMTVADITLLARINTK